MRYDLLVRPQYAQFRGRRLPVAIGRNGIGEKIGEGDNITPIGTWFVEEWLVQGKRTRLNGTNIGPQDKWCDDVNSPQYNEVIHGQTRYSCERLMRPDPLYDIIGVMNYNRDPVVNGKGSAIFIHTWRKPRHPTEGCVAFSRPDLEWIVNNWHEDTKVIIQP